MSRSIWGKTTQSGLKLLPPSQQKKEKEILKIRLTLNLNILRLPVKPCEQFKSNDYNENIFIVSPTVRIVNIGCSFELEPYRE